jgi:hypothetical protein
MNPQEISREFQAEIWDTEAVQQEAMFYCAGTDSADSCPKAEPRELGGLTSTLQKQKSKAHPTYGCM